MRGHANGRGLGFLSGNEALDKDGMLIGFGGEFILRGSRGGQPHMHGVVCIDRGPFFWRALVHGTLRVCVQIESNHNIHGWTPATA